MKFLVPLCFIASLAFVACNRETPNDQPVTEVNRPRPKAVVEPTNEVKIPLTNVPKIITATNK